MNDILNLKLEKKLIEIAEYYLNQKQYINQFGLYGGDSGIALFLALYYKHTHDEKYFNKLNQYIDFIVDNINSTKNLQFSFSSGLAGWGWLIEYLKQEDLVDVNIDDFLSDIDKTLTIKLDNCIANHEFDQLHEGISISLYFLKRGITEPVIKMILALNSSKILDGHEIKWVRNDKYRNLLTYDFGLAHGISGYLYFLSVCHQRNILPNVCKELISGIIYFLNNNIQSDKHVNSFFPAFISLEDYKDRNFNATYCRLAWCYGDLGILSTLLLTGQLLNDTHTINNSTEMLKLTTKRRNFHETSISDAGFCHGSSGVAHIYNNIYKSTGISYFENAANYWFEQTLNFSNNDKNGVCGFLFNEGPNVWLPSTGLLTGLAGVGLVLISYKNEKLTGWDECLLLR